MPISYAMIARDLAVLCEYTDEPTDAEPAKFAHAVLRDVFDKAHPTETRNVFTMGKRVYYYYVFDGLTYICMCDESFQREAAYAMLEETKNDFMSRGGHRSKTPKEFAPQLHAIMVKYENVKIRTKIDVVTDQVKEVKNKMADSLHRLLERGVKMNDLVTKTEKLHHDALVFQQSSTKLKNVLWWKNVKYQLIALLLFFILMWLGASWICGWDMASCSSGSRTRNVPMIRDISHSVSSSVESAQHEIESTVDKAKVAASDALHR